MLTGRVVAREQPKVEWSDLMQALLPRC